MVVFVRFVTHEGETALIRVTLVLHHIDEVPGQLPAEEHLPILYVLHSEGIKILCLAHRYQVTIIRDKLQGDDRVSVDLGEHLDGLLRSEVPDVDPGLPAMLPCRHNTLALRHFQTADLLLVVEVVLLNLEFRVVYDGDAPYEVEEFLVGSLALGGDCAVDGLSDIVVPEPEYPLCCGVKFSDRVGEVGILEVVVDWGDGAVVIGDLFPVEVEEGLFEDDFLSCGLGVVS